MSDIIVYQKKVYVKANPQMLTEAQMEQIINGDVLKLEDTTPVPLGQVPPSAFKQYDPTFDPDPSVYGANSIVKKRQPLSKSNRKVYDFMVNHPGYSIEDIASALGMSYQTVFYHRGRMYYTGNWKKSFGKFSERSEQMSEERKIKLGLM